MIDDFELLKKADVSDWKAQMILIDLDDFGSINTTYGHECGNKIIELVAQELYSGVRRDEGVYTPRNAELYRRFTGGDEFIFLIRGKQVDAVGFLSRLHDRLGLLSEKTEEILGKGKRFHFNFHAAIAPVYRNDKYEHAVTRLESLFLEAKREASETRVCWWNREEQKKYPKGNKIRDFYDKAIEKFKLDPKSSPKKH